jgi:hypothetical protein
MFFSMSGSPHPPRRKPQLSVNSDCHWALILIKGARGMCFERF